MKAGKAFLAALILIAFPTFGFGARENSSRDDSGHRALLLHDATTLEVRRWLDDGSGGALVSFTVGASLLADQGISGVSDADPWNMMLRDSSGTELGLAASPFGVSLFDAASNLLGVTANPLVVDLGVNNDVTVTSGTITANIGTTGGLGLDSTLASILAKIIAAPSTEAKQDDLNALIVIIDAVLDAIKLDTANISSDQATQTTLAAVLAKLSADPSTETTAAAILAKLSADPSTETTLAGIKTGTDKISADQATQTTLAAILAKIIAAPATEAKQDTGNSSLASIAAEDFATQTTLAAILAKIIAAPATEAKQDSSITNTTAIELNTDSPTAFGSATFSVGTSAVEIATASPTRRSLLVRNADSNTVLFVGPTSGVTTANGIPLNTAGASGANGNGGTIIYSHTAAVWAIVSSGTADTRTQSESD